MQASAEVRNSALLLVGIATMGLSIKGIAAKLAYETGINADYLLLVRFAAAVPLFWLGARWLHGSWGHLTQRQWLHCTGAGLLYFIAAFTDFHALLYLDAGLSRLILFTYPVFVLLLQSSMQKRLPGSRELLAFAIIFAGLLVAIPIAEAQENLALGGLFALAAALSYGAYLMYSQVLLQEIESGHFSTATSTITLILFAALVLSSDADPALNINLAGTLWSLFIAVFCTAIPFFLLYEGIKRCGAATASLITLAGPAITLVLAWWWLDEPLGWRQWLGLAILMAGLGLIDKKLSVLHVLRKFQRQTQV